MSAVVVDGVQLREIAEVVRVFGVGSPTDVRVVPEGLMDRNWRVTTPTGVYALKQVQDVDPARVRAAARRDRRLGRARPAGRRADGDPGWCDARRARRLVVDPDAVDPGSHRGGLDLALAECRELGRLLAALHAGLREVMPPAPATLSVPVGDRDEVRPVG